MAAIDRFFASAHSLPALPEVALKLFDTFGREQTTLGEVADLISKDTALSMRVLRMANSARYGMRRQVGHLQDAAALLGLDALRGLALTACLADAFPRPAGFDRRRFWAQNLATAGYARVLARMLHREAGLDEMAGLLLRSGQLLMLIAEPGQVALVESMAGAPDSVFDVERRQFGCTHAEVSAELAARWHLPIALVDALYTAGHPMAAQPFSVSGAIVRLASTMADAGEDALDRCETVRLTHAPLLARLGTTVEALAAWLPDHATVVVGSAEFAA